ncbi:MAG TPA: ZIP family metal transporter [Kineosporiaceae bacterium]|nr:ZIP family metal transporter [Kineosporiaceae bacterium]
MSLSKTLVLGFVAGATILLGLPVGRLRRPAPVMRALLNATAVGVLLFLVWDVLSAAWAPIDAALGDLHRHGTGLGSLAGYGALFAGGLAVGLLGLVGYERWTTRLSGRDRDLADGGLPRFGPGTMATGELRAARLGLASWSPGRRMALLIAVGIGLHNFAEGLAIGQSAAGGAIGLATLLVIGFGLHNATEGFGIVAPLAAEDRPGLERPGWGFLLALGGIGGGPTFAGTALGYGYTSQPLSVAFLALAAGSILYVVLQLIGVAVRGRRTDLLAYGVLLGLLAGFATDAVVSAAGV